MSYVRGQERMVYQRVFDFVSLGLLDQLDWRGTTLGHLPYGASSPLIFQELIPDPKLSMIEPNTVAFSEGRMPTEDSEELGSEFAGGLVSTTHTFFVDIYGEKQSIAKAIGSDVRAMLSGKLGFSRVLELADYRQPVASGPLPVLPGHQIHFEDVEVDFPAIGSASKMHWVVVKLTAIHEYHT